MRVLFLRAAGLVGLYNLHNILHHIDGECTRCRVSCKLERSARPALPKSERYTGYIS